MLGPHKMEQTKAEFIAYLQETLIPDLKDSGHFATAADFEACILFMTGTNKVKIEGDHVEHVN